MNVPLKKAMPFIIVALLAILLFVVRQYQGQDQRGSTNGNTKRESTTSANRDHGFDRRISYLQYSEHAKCRMQCRKISQHEVEEIMQNGTINYNKSDLKNARCPRYALEGLTDDNQRVRIVFAQCNDKTAVVTVIDLNTDWSCECPGDDKNYDNKR